MMTLFVVHRTATADEACQYAELETAFREYVQDIDQAQVEKIQQQLNDGGYGPVSIDGILGVTTRLALQKVCQNFAVSMSDDIADDIVKMLETNSIVIQKEPLWRQTITGEPFKAWIDEKPLEEQRDAIKTLTEGPAEAIITLLNQFSSNVKSAIGQEKSPSDQTSTPACTKQKILPAVDGAEVYYLWQGDKKMDEDGAKNKNQEQCAQAVAKINPDVMAQLNTIKGVAYPNRKLFLQALENISPGTAADDQLQLLIESRNEGLTPPAPLQVEGDGCGCSRDFSSIVYGFYPSWMAQTDQVRQVDFSLFNRIGFYALTLDRNGTINNPLQWDDGRGGATFINMAHQYRVAVDLTLYASDWRSWNDAAINNAVNSTMASAMKKLHDRNAPLSTYLPAMIKNGSSPQADGVTLYFDDYTVSNDGRENIVKFVSRLSKRLQATGRNLNLNIMLGLDTNTLGDQSVFKDLSAILLKSEEEGPAKVDNVLIFLQESTSKAKKNIRRKIEDEFRGADRKAVLRKIIPVISPTGHERDPRGPFSQFTDDLIYLQDNFAGVGFWPLPLRGDNGIDTLRETLVKLYTSTTPSNRFGSMVSNLAPQLCQFACPNRWLFRIGFDLLAGMLLIYALFSIWLSGPRDFFKKHLFYFIAVITATIVIAVISLVCDPFWQKQADVVLIGIIVAGFAYALWRYVGRVTQLPLP